MLKIQNLHLQYAFSIDNKAYCSKLKIEIFLQGSIKTIQINI